MQNLNTFIDFRHNLLAMFKFAYYLNYKMKFPFLFEAQIKY